MTKRHTMIIQILISVIIDLIVLEDMFCLNTGLSKVFDLNGGMILAELEFRGHGYRGAESTLR